MKHDNSPSLPRVEEADLLEILPEDITDPGHEERWSQFSANHPVLAREILARAARMTSPCLNPAQNAEVAKKAIDMTTFAIAALEAACQRQSTSVGGDADEDRQPLA
jgi:hypothetical protein